MASYSTGITATWDSVAFQELFDLSWTYGGGPSKGRSVRWSDEAGSVAISCFGTANTQITNYARRAELTITGGGQSLTNPAVWESLSVANEVNGLTRYTVTLRLLDN